MTLLADLPVGQTARVLAMRLDDVHARWVRAVGIFEEEEVIVLRRAPFGGPLHVRTASGGEFALDRSLATAIEVEVMRPGIARATPKPEGGQEAAE